MITAGLYPVNKEFSEIDKICMENDFSLFTEPSYDGFDTIVLIDNKNLSGREIKFNAVSGTHNLASRMLDYINKEMSIYDRDSKILDRTVEPEKQNRLRKVAERLLELEKEFSNTYVEGAFKITPDAVVNLEQKFITENKRGYRYNGETFYELTNQLINAFQPAFRGQKYQYDNFYYSQEHYSLFDMEKKNNSDRDFIGIGKSPYEQKRRYDFGKDLVLHFCLQKKEAETLANVLSTNKVFSELGIRFAEPEKVDSFIQTYGSKEEVKDKDRPSLKPKKNDKTNLELRNDRS